MYADIVMGIALSIVAFIVGAGEKNDYIKAFGIIALVGLLYLNHYRGAVLIPNLKDAFNNGKELYCTGGRGSGTTVVSKGSGWVLEGDDFVNSGLSMLIRVRNCEVKE